MQRIKKLLISLNRNYLSGNCRTTTEVEDRSEEAHKGTQAPRAFEPDVIFLMQIY